MQRIPALTTIFVLLLLGACGQKGPLFVPADKPDPVTSVETVPDDNEPARIARQERANP